VNGLRFRGAWLLAILVVAIPTLLGQARLTPTELTAAKSMGSRSAPITLEIFSDYQCPDCRRMHTATTRQVIDNYVTSGKVYLIHRDFPLNMHAHAKVAARWANAAAAAGVFEAAENALYNKQNEWAATGNVEAALASVLPAADMRRIRMMETQNRARLDAAVQSDMNLGMSRAVSGTPSIFVIHRGQTTPLPPGSVNYSLLKQYLDHLLAQR
jgi:protein-disulfide isomerase